MARWRLIESHYLPVPGTEYDYKETSEATGKSKRVIFEVPMLLNTNDASDHNYPGEIIVAHGDAKHEPRDIIFVGPPTPAMEPLDDEAKAISESLQASWIPPVESLPANGGALSGEAMAMMKEFASMIGEKINPAAATVVPSVSIEEFNALKAQMAEMAAALAAKSDGTTAPKARRA